MDPQDMTDSKAIETQLAKMFLEETYQNNRDLCTTAYLYEEEAEPEAEPTLFPPQNPFPNHTEQLVHFTIHNSNSKGKILQSHVQLPLALMPVLDRSFVPSRTWHLENIYDAAQTETVSWVAMPMSFYHFCRTPEDFLTAVERMLSETNRCVIVDMPGKAPAHAFWIQVRGCFRDPGDVFIAARKQVDLMRLLVMGGYIVLGKEVLGAEVESAFSLPAKRAHRGLRSRFVTHE